MVHATLCSLNRPVASQPGGGGGLNLDGWNTRRTPPPPLGHCPRDVINLKNAPTLGHSQAPPPWTLPVWRHPIHIFQGWNKIAEGWNKIAEGWNKIAKGWNKIAERWNKIAKGWNKIAKGWNKIAEGWNKIAKGWNKIAERWNKIAKGWNKIAKGWNKIFGMGNWGGSYDPPDPPLATGLIKAWIILFYPRYRLVQFVVLYRGLGILPCMWHAVSLNLKAYLHIRGLPHVFTPRDTSCEHASFALIDL